MKIYSKEIKRYILVLAFVLILLGVIGCNNSSFDNDSNEIKIGAVLPLSGGGALYGQSIMNGMEIAKDELNSKGENIKIVYEDSEADTKKGVSSYYKLVNENNVDIVVSAFSTVSSGITPLSDENEIPLIATLSTAKGLVNDSKYNFRYNVNYEQNAKVAVELIEKRGFNDVALLSVNDEFGNTISNEIIKRLKNDSDISIVSNEKFKLGDSEVRSQVSKIKDSNPDVVLIQATLPSNVITALEDIKKIGVNATVFEAYHSSSPAVRDKISDLNINDFYTAATPFELNYQEEVFTQRYVERYNKSPIRAAANGYDIIKLVNEASMHDRKDISEGLQDLENFNGVQGDINISSNGEINPTFRLVKFVDDSYQVVE